MSIQDPWKVTSIADAVSFFTYLSGYSTGGNFQATPAFFQRGIEWSRDQVHDALTEIFSPTLDAQLLNVGREALDDASYVAANGCAPHGRMPVYENGTGLSRPFFHEIEIQASKKNNGRMVEIIDGQQRTTFWRCCAMRIAALMIQYQIPVIPRALGETLFNNYTRTMTFGSDSSYDRLSHSFCADLHSAKDLGRERILKDHLEAYKEVKARGNDPMVKLYREVDVQLETIIKRIARADGTMHNEEPTINNIQAALYAVARRMLFDCEVRVLVLPKDVESGKHFYTKNSRGAKLSEHALITSALHEHTLPSDINERTEDNPYVMRWRNLTWKLKVSIDEGNRKTLKPEELICHATTIALLRSHSSILASMPSEYLTSLSTCQKKSSGNAFSSICAMMNDATLDVDALLDTVEAILPDFIALYVKSSDAKMANLDAEVVSMFKLCAKGSPSHALMMARVFGCSARDINELAKALTAMVSINGTYELAAKQDLVPKIGRVGSSLNHAIVSCIRSAVRGSQDGKAPQPEMFAKTLVIELIHGSDGASPYYDKLRHNLAIKAIPNIQFGKNNDHLRLLMRMDWHSRNGDHAILRDNDIEHILPITPNAEAVKESGLVVKNIGQAKDNPAWSVPTSLIGNRAWLPTSTNRSVGNGSFSQKKMHFEARMSKGQGQGPDVLELVSYGAFGMKQINERGLRVAGRVDTVWTNWIPNVKPSKSIKAKKVSAANDSSMKTKHAA